MVLSLVHPLVHVQVTLGTAALTAQTTDVRLGVGRPDVGLEKTTNGNEIEHRSFARTHGKFKYFASIISLKDLALLFCRKVGSHNTITQQYLSKVLPKLRQCHRFCPMKIYGAAHS